MYSTVVTHNLQITSLYYHFLVYGLDDWGFICFRRRTFVSALMLLKTRAFSSSTLARRTSGIEVYGSPNSQSLHTSTPPFVVVVVVVVVVVELKLTCWLLGNLERANGQGAWVNRPLTFGFRLLILLGATLIFSKALSRRCWTSGCQPDLWSFDLSIRLRSLLGWSTGKDFAWYVKYF